MSDEARKARAAARGARMTIVRGEQGDAAPISGLAAVALAARLSRQQWLLAGKKLPTYSRAEMPMVILPAKG